jgi:glycine/D-amino acid oxidase-like deaminating enzyme
LSIDEGDGRIRVGIIGGGIAGVAVAHSLAKSIQGKREDVDIIVLEADGKGGGDMSDCDILRGHSPDWIAASARNANTVAPGVAMHVFSHRLSVYQILRDTATEWVIRNYETIKSIGHPDLLKRIDNFDIVPPYFALHLFRCIGPSASWEERKSFFRFIYQFLYTAMIKGEDAAHSRGDVMVKLAKATRHGILNELTDGPDKNTIMAEIGYSSGFMSLHRTLEQAEFAVKEAQGIGEESELLKWEDAIEVEPRLEYIPNKMWAVLRKNDFTASCEIFIRKMIQQCTKFGVKYHNAQVTELTLVDASKQTPRKRRFRIRTADGDEDTFDILVLAAGINTPLWAARIGAGSACPTYPLRGYSLSFFPEGDRRRNKTGSNLLKQAFSLDSMYCSSVTGNMIRIAGFGELVGYREKATHVPSVGPRVMARYCKTLFPDVFPHVSMDDAQQCFRPLSPDDIPLAGSVAKCPGLFIHSGHGTLGWTTGLATGVCVAQAISDYIEGKSEKETMFVLPDNTEIERAALSPDRFT